MQLIRSALSQSMSSIQTHIEWLAGHVDDAEAVHQLRVGLRRLRTVLRDMGGLCEGISPQWEPQLGDTFRALGAHRDWVILETVIRPLLEEAGAPLTRWSMPVLPDLQSILMSPPFQATWREVQAFEIALHHAKPPDRHEVLKWVAHRLDHLQKQVLLDGRHFEHLAGDRQHQVRKRLKRLGYLCDMAAPLWPQSKRQIKRYLAGIKAAQDALGFHHDLFVAAQHFRSACEQDANAWFAVGYLQGRMALSAREAQDAIWVMAKHALSWETL